MLSIILDGVRWGVKAPQQIRVSPNLERMDTHTHGVSASFSKLIDKGLYYKFKKLRRVDEATSIDGPCPFIFIQPFYVAAACARSRRPAP